MIWDLFHSPPIYKANITLSFKPREKNNMQAKGGTRGSQSPSLERVKVQELEERKVVEKDSCTWTLLDRRVEEGEVVAPDLGCPTTGLARAAGPVDSTMYHRASTAAR